MARAPYQVQALFIEGTPLSLFPASEGPVSLFFGFRPFLDALPFLSVLFPRIFLAPFFGPQPGAPGFFLFLYLNLGTSRSAFLNALLKEYPQDSSHWLYIFSNKLFFFCSLESHPCFFFVSPLDVPSFPRTQGGESDHFSRDPETKSSFFDPPFFPIFSNRRPLFFFCTHPHLTSGKDSSRTLRLFSLPP